MLVFVACIGIGVRRREGDIPPTRNVRSTIKPLHQTSHHDIRVREYININKPSHSIVTNKNKPIPIRQFPNPVDIRT